MAINFQNLPQDNPFALPNAGVYRAKIVEAEMRTPKTDASKPDYLNLKLTLFDVTNKNCGSIFDIISESDSSIVQYKIARFVRACKIPLTGSMELRDLAKVVKGKEIAVDVRIGKDNKDQPKAEVDLFSREGYYMPEEFMEIYYIANPDAAEKAEFETMNNTPDEEIPFDAQDGGAPAGQPGVPTEY
jgi:hypothetical protein